MLEAVVATFEQPSELFVWLGPAIGPTAFEVGDEVRQAFIANDSKAMQGYVESGADTNEDNYHWFADIYLLARQCLQQQGITHICGGEFCTFTDSERFYSYRRDGKAGRIASVIWVLDF